MSYDLTCMTYYQKKMFRKIRQLDLFRYDFVRKIHSTTTDDVLFDHIHKTGVIQLNRPKTLNALTFSMIRKIFIKLKQWQADDRIQSILVKSTDSRAFSAGGDIKLLSLKTSDGIKRRNDYLRDEYQLLYLIGNSKKPYVAFIDGITMGGGCGLSIHGTFRIATERTVVAMPETAIGVFPNAGGSYFLSRLSNNLGVFLGLTGHRLRSSDVVYAGLATHFIPSSQLTKVEQQILDIPRSDYHSIKEILDQNSLSIKSFSLQEQLSLINRVFSPDTKNIETIFHELKSNGSSFALEQLAILQKKSPTSLKLTIEELKRGKQLDLKECLKMEYRILQYRMNDFDFFEGVRTVLIDKDDQPQWQSSCSDQQISEYFRNLPSNEELLI